MEEKQNVPDEYIGSGLDKETIDAMEAALAQVEAAKAKAAQVTPAELLADYIGEQTKQERVSALSMLTLNPPEGLTREEVKALLANAVNEPAMMSVALVKGSKDVYYYDKGLMTERFATVQSLIEDKDILATVAATARHDSRVYPRPSRMQVFLDSPYFYSEDEILGALARMKGNDSYDDIGTVTASNNKICIYSTRFMSRKYAQALCEEMEVTWRLSQ